MRSTLSAYQGVSTKFFWSVVRSRSRSSLSLHPLLLSRYVLLRLLQACVCHLQHTTDTYDQINRGVRIRRVHDQHLYRYILISRQPNCQAAAGGFPQCAGQDTAMQTISRLSPADAVGWQAKGHEHGTCLVIRHSTVRPAPTIRLRPYIHASSPTLTKRSLGTAHR